MSFVIVLFALAALAMFAPAVQAPVGGDVKIPPPDPNADHPLNHIHNDPNDYGEPGSEPEGAVAVDDDEDLDEQPVATTADDTDDDDGLTASQTTTIPTADAPIEPEGETPVNDGLVEIADQFGQIHRVPPQTAALIRWQANENQRLQGQTRLTAEPQNQPAAPASGPAPEPGSWEHFLQRFDALERDFRGVSGTLNQATESRRREALAQDAMTYFDTEIIKTVPMLAQRPQLATVIKGRLSRNLAAALAGNVSHLTPQQVRDALYVDTMNEIRELGPLVHGQTVAKAQTRAQAARTAMPASGGSQGATAKPKAKAPTDVSSEGFWNFAREKWKEIGARRRRA